MGNIQSYLENLSWGRGNTVVGVSLLIEITNALFKANICKLYPLLTRADTNWSCVTTKTLSLRSVNKAGRYRSDKLVPPHKIIIAVALALCSLNVWTPCVLDLFLQSVLIFGLLLIIVFYIEQVGLFDQTVNVGSADCWLKLYVD